MIKLGPLQLEHPFVLAPMAGITDSPFRRLMRKHGASLVVSELVSANGIAYAGEKTLKLLHYEPDERPIGLQIFGEEVSRLCEAARLIERLGADFVDLNMGCPVPKVVKKGGGAAMTRNPLELSRILRAMVESVKIPVTIKIRSGWDESSRNAHEVVRVAADAGVAFVAIHGRTRAQGYSGEADWDFIGDLKAKSSIPIIGNGDLVNAEIANRRLRESGVDAVMIGRPALRNPFIFEQARAVWKGEAPLVATHDRFVSAIEELGGLFSSFYNPHTAMIQARKFLAWFSSGFPGCHEFRRKVFTIANPEDLWCEAREFFEKNAHAADERQLNGGFLMGGHG
ncbi:MAG: tRNA dihydrouridine synthase DusB [Bdellovibrionales bacterium GWB1_55_8]|nr:MAG: tRNA dihydrouridine synthase DusB [Bdellovibrionales bacterium GWB1_55_8]